MMDEIPVQVWILLVLALIAWTPAEYVYRYRREAPSKELLAAPANSGWRDTGQFRRCVAILLALAGIAAFIFTPAAERFAQSGFLVPLIGTGVAIMCLYEGVKGLLTGQVEPVARSSLGPYARDQQPVRFWLSIAWNLTLGITMVWALIMFDFYISNEA